MLSFNNIYLIMLVEFSKGLVSVICICLYMSSFFFYLSLQLFFVFPASLSQHVISRTPVLSIVCKIYSDNNFCFLVFYCLTSFSVSAVYSSLIHSIFSGETKLFLCRGMCLLFLRSIILLNVLFLLSSFFIL